MIQKLNRKGSLYETLVEVFNGLVILEKVPSLLRDSCRWIPVKVQGDDQGIQSFKGT